MHADIVIALLAKIVIVNEVRKTSTIMGSLGGKWSRLRGGSFPCTPLPPLDKILASGMASSDKARSE